jgi:ATP-dependent Clp protease adaptor protein ClpS
MSTRPSRWLSCSPKSSKLRPDEEEPAYGLVTLAVELGFEPLAKLRDVIYRALRAPTRSGHNRAHAGRLLTTTAPAEVEVERAAEEAEPEHDRPWIVIVWNDPINLMSYVTLVFQKLFGYSREKATQLMLQVHHEGKAVVSGGTRERAEHDVARLHAHGLWATMRQD